MLVGKPAAPEPITEPPAREPDPEKIITIFEPLESPIDREFTEPIPETAKPASEPMHGSTPSGFEPEGKHYTTISGPSFLGLTDDSPSEPDSTSYLLEEEPSARRHAGWYVFSFIAIAILAGIGILEWRAIQTGKLSIPFIHDSTAESAPKPSEPPVQNQSTDQTATNADQQSASQAPWGNPQAKPDTDQSAPVASDEDKQATTDAQSRLAKQADDSRSKTASSESSDQSAESASSSASEKAPTETATAKEPSAPSSAERTPKTEGTTSKRPERTPEKPDPKQNQMLITGEKYLYGRGVPRDCSQALIYFRAAAEQGNAPAMSHLGALYASGECTRQSRTMAYTWFRRAQDADPSNEWISKNMNMVWRDMTPQERASITQ